MIQVDPETLEDEDEPEAEAMDRDDDGEGEEVSSDKELDLVDNLRLYLDHEVEFDSEDRRAMGRAIRVFRECIKGFLLRLVSWLFKPTFLDPHPRECPTLHHFLESLVRCRSILVHSPPATRKRVLDADRWFSWTWVSISTRLWNT